MLRERIERIFPATLNDTIPPYADFDGTADQISFLGEARDSQRPSALRRYRLALDTDGDLVLTAVSERGRQSSVAQETKLWCCCAASSNSMSPISVRSRIAPDNRAGN